MLYDLRKSVFEANLLLSKYGLVIFTWGNVSGIDRESGLVAIKPSGVEYDKMTVDDIVIVDLKGKQVFGRLNPSSDTKTHLFLYNEFQNVNGIVHTHSEWATTWAQAAKSIPVYGTTHADHFYGPVPCTRSLTVEETVNEYEKNTGKVVVEYFAKNNIDPETMPAVLVNGHGPFTWGNSPLDAVNSSVVLEQVAKMAFRTEVMGMKKPVDNHILDKHFKRKHGDDAYYGQK